MKRAVRERVSLLVMALGVMFPSSRSFAQRSGTFDPVKQDDRYEELVRRARGQLRARSQQPGGEPFEPAQQDVMREARLLGRDTPFGRLMTGDDLRLFTVLMVDPARSASSVSSPWTSVITATDVGSEARVEANLMDLFPADSVDAFTLAVVGPLTKGKDLTDLVTLDGLVGTTRGELHFTRRATDASGKPLFTLQATAATPRFAFRRADLSKDDIRKPVFIVGAGFVFKWVEYAVVTNYKYQNLFKGATERSLCTELASGPPVILSCESAALSPPSHVVSNVVEVELRHAFAKVGAASVRLTRDMDHATTGVDVPVWLLTQPPKKPITDRNKQDDKRFGGGVRLGYRSDAPKHATLSIFVGLFKL